MSTSQSILEYCAATLQILRQRDIWFDYKAKIKDVSNILNFSFTVKLAGFIVAMVTYYVKRAKVSES